MGISLRTLASNALNSILRARSDNSSNRSAALKENVRNSQNIRQNLNSDQVSTGKTSNADIAKRQAKIQISDSVSLLNKKEDLTKKQLDDVDKLLAIAKKIKTETDDSKNQSLADDAATIIDSSNSGYDTAISSDSRLAESSLAVAKLSSADDNFLKTSITATRSLDYYGVQSELSFSKEDIDSTITSLEAAKGTIQNQVTAYDSIRSVFSSALKETTNQSNLLELANSGSFENLADKIISQFSSS
nr:hypothetical protein [Pseudomonadota bacterium]